MSDLFSMRGVIGAPLEGLLTGILEAWLKGRKRTRVAIGSAVVAGSIALAIGIASSEGHLPRIVMIPAFVIAAGGIFILLAISAYQQLVDAEAQTSKIEDLAQEARENPDKPLAAWDLGRIKLEHYMDKNIAQISSIYAIVIVVMIAGFGLIGFGVYRIILDDTAVLPATLAAASGVIVQFIGATFLIVYRSAMTQAQGYVEVLERINAVGMSIQILESLEETNKDLRDNARVALASDLLRMYAPQRRTGASRKSARAAAK